MKLMVTFLSLKWPSTIKAHGRTYRMRPSHSEQSSATVWSFCRGPRSPLRHCHRKGCSRALSFPSITIDPNTHDKYRITSQSFERTN